MRGVFWNIRGLGKEGRLQRLHDLCHQFSLDFVGIQETKKQNFTTSYLESMVGGKQFCWNWLPFVGSAGGILFGISLDTCEVLSWEVRSFSLSCLCRIKKNGMLCNFITVYGPTYEDQKESFLAEMRVVCDNDTPQIIGGDFNMVRSHEDKNNGVIDQTCCDRFNSWIDDCGLIDMNLIGRKYTWTNNQDEVILSHIDMIFCTTNFNLIFPLATCKALPRSPSDHTPLLWEDGEDQDIGKPKFRFEKWWLKQSQFADLVKNCWDRACSGSPMEIWQTKIRNLRKKIKGWSINLDAAIKKKKNDMLKEFDGLDKIQETQCLSQSQNN